MRWMRLTCEGSTTTRFFCAPKVMDYSDMLLTRPHAPCGSTTCPPAPPQGDAAGKLSSNRDLLLEEIPEDCPHCDMMFSMLETNEAGERVQKVEMQERG